ncbi:MAG: methyltransferase type 11 [Desulfuromonas sp.]|nr:MAG: methyltransferase type 11 [Desulfuromonas sp.]
MSFYARLMAAGYDLVMQRMERACLAQWRSSLLGPVSGDLLEIGSGTGANAFFYPPEVGRLILTEPDRHMQRRLKRKLAGRYRVVGCSADALPFADRSFDVVVSTLVLCSVPDPATALAEMYRVLRPGGRLVFIEHVAAPEGERLLSWQRFWQPAWRKMAGNCHLTRKTEQAILAAGFSFDRLERTRSRGGPAFVSPTIMGTAVRRMTTEVETI